MSLPAVLSRLDASHENTLARLKAWLAIPSISTDPGYRAEVRRAGGHLVADLTTMGFEASLRETPGHPVVVGHRRRPGKPHILFYGHYDVQPVDPLELWEQPPFEPVVKEISPGGPAICARGASDDKGQIMTFLEACRAIIAETGDLPVSLSVMIEGEEENGSINLPEFLEKNAAEFKADICLVCDTGMWDRGRPQITSSLRGLLYEEIIVRAANRDLHSGHFGGTAQNPIHILARIIAAMHDAEGRVAVPHFYDGVHETGDNRKASWEALGLTEADFLGTIGLKFAAGERGRTLIEKIQARPTCDCNGIWGGYTGAGTKTVIAAQARAKISFRLVQDQDPKAIQKNFREYVAGMIPPDCSVEFIGYKGSRAVQVSEDSPDLRLAVQALRDEWGTEPVVLGHGGSIPVVGDFKRLLGLDALLIGWSLDDDRIHSPNEKYDLENFYRGQKSWARILLALAKR
ncbi:MAG: M20/M25/M40 family metallo-hydrolase [Methylobacterium sp.]|nr:M20/M25/M40 family metallo-hydrolase [Methylobacterium sp.]MCA3652067.1 M20/M25/M40 family metallo-hydrolase [Methylobacterium sp.]MCA4923176.1 M20/M25/M40 family metallo-hydrolase [Methylobacterium sp.]